MGELFNRTWRVAVLWQTQIVWIRMNVAYIKAELPYLAAKNHDTADIESVVSHFDSAFSRFCDEELLAFTSARSVEVDSASRGDLAAKLRTLRNCFLPWIGEYNGVVQARRAAGDQTLGLSLLLGCGAELLEAHRLFVNTMDDYVRELELQTL